MALVTSSRLLERVQRNRVSQRGTAAYRGGVALTTFIENDLPTTLIYIPEMKLIGSGEIRDKARSEIRRRAGKSGRWSAKELASDSPRWADIVETYKKEVLQYVILSHRWGNGEPTFQEMQTVPAGPTTSSRWDTPCDQKPGFSKLRRFCETARLYGFDWAWSDTCCIDKTSSSDIDRAIQSMYRWYRDAELCMVYLANTTRPADIFHDVWFSRAWTLQELLAPTRIKFFNTSWQPLTGTHANDKDAQSPLFPHIEYATGISKDTLQTFKPGTDDVTVKMCWAARREATKIEDVAYSLIGIFGVSMPIAYGEGEHAFYRLQLEIMARAARAIDLLIWCGDSSATSSSLARSPQCFADMESLAAGMALYRIVKPSEHLLAMTNLGLRTEVILHEVHLIPQPADSDAYEYNQMNSNVFKVDRFLPRTMLSIGVRALPAPTTTHTYFLAKIAASLGPFSSQPVSRYIKTALTGQPTLAFHKIALSSLVALMTMVLSSVGLLVVFVGVFSLVTVLGVFVGIMVALQLFLYHVCLRGSEETQHPFARFRDMTLVTDVARELRQSHPFIFRCIVDEELSVAILLEKDSSTGRYRRICTDQAVFMSDEIHVSNSLGRASTVIIE